VAVSTIHFYEAKGLIKGWRSAGNQRRYSRDVLRRVAIIKVAQRLGLPLSMIKQAIDSLPGGRTPTARDWRRLSAEWRKAWIGASPCCRSFAASSTAVLAAAASPCASFAIQGIAYRIRDLGRA
jgi:hypothetical protein